MARKGINIYKRKDGRWEARYKVRATGKYRSVYGKSYSEARQKLIERQNQLTIETQKCDLTVKELFELWLCHIRHKIKESTYANYKMKLELHIYPILGNMKYENVDGKQINDFISNRLSDGRINGGALSGKYVSDIVALLKSLGKFAEREYNYRNPIRNINSPKIHQKELTIYSKEKTAILKNYLLHNLSELHLGVLLCMYTGIRLGEVCALRWSDIDFENQVIRIRKTVQRVKSFDGKNSTRLVISSPKSEKSTREIPFSDFLCKFLSSNKKSGNCFVLSGREKLIEPRLMQYHFKRILKKSKLPSVNFHALRHMFATNCIKCGVDVKSLSEILGHSSVEITLNRYTHSSRELKKDYMERLSIAI